MNINIIDAVYCLWQDSIVTLSVCKGARKICQYYKGERIRTDGTRELICGYGEGDDKQ